MNVDNFGELKKLVVEAEQKDFNVAAVLLYSRMLELKPESDALWFRLSDSLSAIGRYSEAREALSKVKVVPESRRGQIELVRATINQGLGDLTGAEASLRKAVELDPKTTVTWVYLAQFLGLHDQTEEAIGVLNKCIEVAAVGDQDEVHWMLGTLLLRIGKTEEAEAAFKSALDLSLEDYPEPRKGLEEIGFLKLISGKINVTT
jgi:tetratricopeptide (TPR) repeat protein